MSVYKRGKTWYVRVFDGGKEIRRSVGTEYSKALAVQKHLEDQIAKAKASGKAWTGLEDIEKEENGKTFGVASKDYLEERADKKPSTIAAYTYILKSHLLPAFGNVAMNKITGSELRKYQAKLGKTCSPSRVNTIMQLLISIMGQAYREGDIEKDATKSIKRVQEPKVKIDPLSEEELTLFLSKVDQHYRPIFTALAYTGARPNEMQALRWGDLDWQKKSLSISKGRVRGHEGLPKTKSSERVIPMVPIVENTLSALRESKLRDVGDHVFVGKTGVPIDKHLDRIWTRGLKKAGLRHRPSYQLRHTFATHCLMKGLPLPYVARLLGHSTMDTTIRHYASWVDSATAEHDNRLMGVFAGSAQKSAQPHLDQESQLPRPATG